MQESAHVCLVQALLLVLMQPYARRIVEASIDRVQKGHNVA